MWNILYILIILTSVMFLPIKDAFGIPKQAVFIVVGFTLVASSFMNTNSKTLTFKNKWIGLVFIYTIFLSFVWHFFIPLLSNSPKFMVASLQTYLTTMSIITAILLIQCLVEYTDDLNRWVKVAKFLCWVGFGFSIYALIQFCGLDQIFHNGLTWFNNPYGTEDHFVRYKMVTFLGNKRETACFLAMLSPMALMFKGLRYKIVYGVIAFTILLTFSFTGILALTVGFLIYLLLSNRWKIFLVGVLATPLIGWGLLKLDPHFFNFYGKGLLWKKVFLGTIPDFFLGNGLGSFPLLAYKGGLPGD
ncbi:hypothetical protein LCGC14_2507590, partial [marine sediment metagenome]